jgi:hypothetical protein
MKNIEENWHVDKWRGRFSFIFVKVNLLRPAKIQFNAMELTNEI